MQQLRDELFKGRKDVFNIDFFLSTIETNSIFLFFFFFNFFFYEWDVIFLEDKFHMDLVGINACIYPISFSTMSICGLSLQIGKQMSLIVPQLHWDELLHTKIVGQILHMPLRQSS